MVMGFKEASDLVCSAVIEGGYVNNPKDPGKETNFGITKANWDRAVSLGLVRPGVAVKDRTREESLVVYRAFFWDAYHCDELPYPLALAFFDTVVNFTPIWAVRALQHCVGCRVDGVMGTATVLAANKAEVVGTPDTPGSLMKLLKMRMEYYLHEEPADVEEEFELGWADRLLDILFAAMLAR